MSEMEFYANLSRQIGELCADIRAVMDRLEKGDERMANHEARISAIEHCKHAPDGDSFKMWLIKALVKIIGWGAVIIGSLTGAGEMLKRVSVGG